MSMRNLERESKRIGMRTVLEVLNSVDHIITTSDSDSECMSVSVNSNLREQRENRRMSMRIDLGLEFL